MITSGFIIMDSTAMIPSIALSVMGPVSLLVMVILALNVMVLDY